ncbi:MAG TPA: type II toxin-antitoxin system VapB family antitoxin [Candidatus Solibacter sp.]|nr:type II toxin-antitoxin system VapB family antitoxin [Candidatus Solibacter sp.]
MKKRRSAKSLILEDPEAHRLAQMIAELTGETISIAVTQALRERYDRLQNRRGIANVEELLAIADRAAALLKRPYPDHAEILYNDLGLPK